MRTLAVFALLFAGCASTLQTIPPEWTTVPEAARIGAVALDAAGKVSRPGVPPLKPGPIRVEGGRLMNGDQAITDAFVAIDSFDESNSRGEVIFSAKRDATFDIGLVASDGSATNWIPADPSDEVQVTWAPRGNKVSYFVRSPLGDLVRTFHVPTSYQFALDFGPAALHALGWDPQAERFAVAYSTVDASDRVEVMRYDGTERRMAIPPAKSLGADVLPFGARTIALRPQDPRYGEKFPVVVWVAERFEWSDARAALMQNGRVAVLVTTRPPDGELWKAIRESPWADQARVFLVGTSGGSLPAGVVQIIGDPSVPAGRYRRSGTVVSVSPAAIQSFAAGFIADQRKRTSATNGSSR